MGGVDDDDNDYSLMPGFPPPSNVFIHWAHFESMLCYVIHGGREHKVTYAVTKQNSLNWV